MVPHDIGSRLTAGGRPLKVGWLVDGLRQPAWACDVVRQVQALSCVQVAQVMVPDRVSAASTSERAAASWWRRVCRFYRRWMPDPHLLPLGPAPGPHADVLEDVSPLLQGVSVHALKADQEDDGWVADERAVAELRAHKLDVLIQLGTTCWRGSILSAARMGVWCIYPGDRHAYPGGPPGVWEVIEQNPVTMATLEIVSDEPAEQVVLQQAATSTCRWSIRASWNLMYWHALPMVARTLHELWREGEERFMQRRMPHTRPTPASPRRHYASPTRREIQEFTRTQQALIQSEQAIDTSMMRQWILLSDTSGAAGCPDLSRFRRLTPPPDRVWADPFVVQVHGQTVVLFEEHLLARPHAHISAMTVAADGTFGVAEKVLERPYHLSYPFVFEHRGQWYMIPETRGHRTVELYISREFPRRWELCRTLLDNLDAVDATLWQDDQRWWMFVGVIESRGSYTWTDLHLYHAEDPVEGEWKPHPHNPVVADARRSRPAGQLFRCNGVLHRPAQDGSVRYGYGLRMQEVTELSLDRYAEREVYGLEPNWAPDLCGVHTINHAGDLTMADARIVRPKPSTSVPS